MIALRVSISSRPCQRNTSVWYKHFFRFWLVNYIKKHKFMSSSETCGRTTIYNVLRPPRTHGKQIILLPPQFCSNVRNSNFINVTTEDDIVNVGNAGSGLVHSNGHLYCLLSDSTTVECVKPLMANAFTLYLMILYTNDLHLLSIIALLPVTRA